MADEYNSYPREMCKLPDEMLFRKSEENTLAPEYVTSYPSYARTAKKKSTVTKMLIGTLFGTMTLTSASLFYTSKDVDTNDEVIEATYESHTDESLISDDLIALEESE